MREMRKRIVAVSLGANRGFAVRHDIPGEQIVCEVPTLEIAGCIVRALRERCAVRLAEQLLARHVEQNRKRAATKLKLTRGLTRKK